MTQARGQGIGGRATAWLRAVRLQFYPMTWLAYSLGTVAASTGGFFAPRAFWAGFAALVLLEMATVFTNELADYETDRRNTHAGPFNGGSRVLVEGRLPARALQYSAGVAIAGAVLATIAVAAVAPGGSALPAMAVIGVFGVLALGYTLPPLMLAYRGAAEITVAATHSTGPLLLGYALQGGPLLSVGPWLLSLPLLLAILPAITLAGIADSTADRSVAKHTLAVRRGTRHAAGSALVTTAAAAIAAFVVAHFIGPVYGTWAPVIAVHGVVLMAALLHYRRAGARAGRIDGLLVIALTYIVWFTVLPLLALTG